MPDPSPPPPLRPLEFFPDAKEPEAVPDANEPSAVAVAGPVDEDESDVTVELALLLPFFFFPDWDAEGEGEDPVAADVVSDTPLPPPTPGSDVMSVNWLPSLIGPLGFALHEPAGETGLDMPNGMVPLLPGAPPPTKMFGSSPSY
jgi:hypothetical protein